MAKIVPLEVHPNSPAFNWREPFYVTIDGKRLETHDHRLRLFKTDIEACAAAIDEVNAHKRSEKQI